MRKIYAKALYKDPAATLDDLREAVTTLEDAKRIARRVLGGAHPDTAGIEAALRSARAALRALETLVDNLRKAVKKLEDALPDARRDLGSSDPLVGSMERNLRDSRAALRARDTTYIERDLRDARPELSARADEIRDPNKGMSGLVEFFAAIKPYDGGKETE